MPRLYPVRISCKQIINNSNPITTIQYNLPEDINVMLEVFNVHGQKVKSYKKAGKHTISKRMLLIK